MKGAHLGANTGRAELPLCPDRAHFKSDLTSNPTTPDEWHTAEVLIGLHHSSSEFGSNTPIMSKCVKWLESRRGDRFLWCNDMGSRISFIITGRVLHALALVDPSKAGVAKTVCGH